MATPFTSETVRSSYPAILRTGSFAGFSEVAPQVVADGSGIETPLYLSEDIVNISGGFQLSGVAITATAAEINKLDRSFADGLVEASKVAIADASGTIDCIFAKIKRPQLDNYIIRYNNCGQVTSAADVSVASGQVHRYELIGSPVTFTFTDSPASGYYSPFRMVILQDSTGGRSVNWPGNVEWYLGQAPNLNDAPFGKTIVDFITTDGGNSYIGSEINPSILYKQFIVPDNNQAPTFNPATSDSRNSRDVLDFDDTTEESAIFPIYIDNNYRGSGLSVTIIWAASSATSDNVYWAVSFENCSANDLDMDSDSFATAVNSAGAANAVSGKLTYTTITFTNNQIDGLSAGEFGRLKISRAAADGNDTMTGDAEVYAIILQEG